MVILDGPGHSSGRPTVVYGARGIVTVDLTVYGPTSGVHSGNYGNWMPNPALRLATLLASMKDDEGRVTIAGYYDAVAPLTPEERAMLDAVPDDSARMLQTFGVAAPEKAFPKLQDAMQVPTLNIRGLASSFVGAGARTIIPDRATAAIDIRLVKETSGEDLVTKLRAAHRQTGLPPGRAREPDDATRARYEKLARVTPVGPMLEAFRTRGIESARPRARRLHDADLRPAARAAAHARRHGPDRAVHRRARLPRAAGADGQLRQQPARGKREPSPRHVPATASSRSRRVLRMRAPVESSEPVKIDINCDMGESFGPWTMGADAEVMPHITSANIACGAHAGDPSVMRRTVRLAARGRGRCRRASRASRICRGSGGAR